VFTTTVGTPYESHNLRHLRSRGWFPFEGQAGTRLLPNLMRDSIQSAARTYTDARLSTLKSGISGMVDLGPSSIAVKGLSAVGDAE